MTNVHDGPPPDGDQRPSDPSAGLSPPALILVTGAPATGKSALAAKLADALALPLIAKDDVKELLADTLAVSGLDWSRRLGAASFRLIDRLSAMLLVRGVSVILEANWDHAFTDQEFRRLVAERRVRVIEVFCRTEAAVLLERYRRRGASGARHPIHVDEIYADDAAFQQRIVDTFREPLGLGGPVIIVDTTDFGTVDGERIVADVRRAIEGEG